MIVSIVRQKSNSKSFSICYRYIKKEYKNPQVFITGNGWADDGKLEDKDRIEYLRDHLLEVRDAIVKDKCDVRGYTGKILMVKPVKQIF